MPEGDRTCGDPCKGFSIANSRILRVAWGGARHPQLSTAGQSMYLILCYIYNLIMEHEIKIEQNWGTNPDEDRQLLGSLSLEECTVLFEVCIAFVPKHG